MSRIDDLVHEGAQFVVATHSPILMAYPNATINVLSDAGIASQPWTDIDHVQITRSFLEAPERFFRHLLD